MGIPARPALGRVLPRRTNVGWAFLPVPRWVEYCFAAQGRLGQECPSYDLSRTGSSTTAAQGRLGQECPSYISITTVSPGRHCRTHPSIGNLGLRNDMLAGCDRVPIDA